MRMNLKRRGDSCICEIRLRALEPIRFVGDSPQEALGKALAHIQSHSEDYAAWLMPRDRMTKDRAKALRSQMSALRSIVHEFR